MEPAPELRRPSLWPLIWVALIAECAFAVLNISTMPVYLRNDRGIGESAIGLIFVSFLLSETLLRGPIGAISDRVGPRFFIVLGSILAAISSLLTLLLPRGAGAAEVFGFVVLRAIDGLAAAMIWPAVFSHAGDLTSDQTRMRAMGWLNTCYLVGIAIALPLGGFVNDSLGTRLFGDSQPRAAGIVLSSCLFFLSGLIAILIARVKDHAPKPVKVGLPSGLRMVLTENPKLLLVSFLVFLAIGFPMPTFKLYFEQVLGFSETSFGLLTLPFALGMAVTSPFITRWGENLGQARSVRVGLQLCVAGLAPIGLSVLLPRHEIVSFAMVGAIPLAIGFLLALPAWMSAVSNLFPERRGATIGAVMAAQGFGAVLGALIGPVIYERVGWASAQVSGSGNFGRTLPFTLSLIAVIAALIISRRALPETRPYASEKS